MDVALLQGQQAQELILKQTPRKLYVQIPGATWKYSNASLVSHGSLFCHSWKQVLGRSNVGARFLVSGT